MCQGQAQLCAKPDITESPGLNLRVNYAFNCMHDDATTQATYRLPMQAAALTHIPNMEYA